jgi:hypothetical protein
VVETVGNGLATATQLASFLGLVRGDSKGPLTAKSGLWQWWLLLDLFVCFNHREGRRNSGSIVIEFADIWMKIGAVRASFYWGFFSQLIAKADSEKFAPG